MVSSTRRRPRAGNPTDAQAETERECRAVRVRAEAVMDEKGAGAVEMAQLCV